MDVRKKIIVYGGGAVILIAIIFSLMGNKTTGQKTTVVSGVDPAFAQAQLEFARLNSVNQNALNTANIQANTAISLAGIDRDVRFADIKANFETAQSAIERQAEFDSQAIRSNVTLGLAQFATELAITRDNNQTDLDSAIEFGNTATRIRQIDASVDLASISVAGARDQAIIANIGLVKKKDRDNVFKTLVSGINDSPASGPSKTAEVINAGANLAKGVAKIFGK